MAQYLGKSGKADAYIDEKNQVVKVDPEARTPAGKTVRIMRQDGTYVDVDASYYADQDGVNEEDPNLQNNEDSEPAVEYPIKNVNAFPGGRTPQSIPQERFAGNDGGSGEVSSSKKWPEKKSASKYYLQYKDAYSMDEIEKAFPGFIEKFKKENSKPPEGGNLPEELAPSRSPQGSLDEALKFKMPEESAPKKASDKEGKAGFIKKHHAAFSKAAEKLGVPVEFVAGKAALETGFGKSGKLIDSANNPFGIKAKDGEPGIYADTTEFVNGKPKKSIEKFKKFNSVDEAAEAYAKIIQKNYPQSVGAKTPEAFAIGLIGGKKKYATDPEYGKKLTSFIGKAKEASSGLEPQVNFANQDAFYAGEPRRVQGSIIPQQQNGVPYYLAPNEAVGVTGQLADALKFNPNQPTQFNTSTLGMSAISGSPSLQAQMAKNGPPAQAPRPGLIPDQANKVVQANTNGQIQNGAASGYQVESYGRDSIEPIGQGQSGAQMRQDQIPSMNDLYKNIYGPYAKGFAMQEKATTDDARIAQDIANQRVPLEIEQQRMIEERNKQFFPEIEKQKADFDKAIRDFSGMIENYKSQAAIDPYRLWRDKTESDKSSLALMIGLGAIGAGLTGGPNYALNIVEKAIDRDIDAQKAALDKGFNSVKFQESLLGQIYNRFNNLSLAESMVRRLKMDDIEAKLGVVAAKSAGPLAANQAQKMLADIQMKKAALNQQIQSGVLQWQREQALMKGYMQGAINPMLAEKYLDKKDAGELYVIRHDGQGAFYAQDKESAQAIRQSIKTYEEINEDLDTLEGILEKEPVSARMKVGDWLKTGAAAHANAIISKLKMRVKDKFKLGAMNESDYAITNSMLPNLGNWFDTNKRIMDDIRDENRRAINRAYKYGSPYSKQHVEEK